MPCPLGSYAGGKGSWTASYHFQSSRRLNPGDFEYHYLFRKRQRQSNFLVFHESSLLKVEAKESSSVRSYETQTPRR